MSAVEATARQLIGQMEDAFNNPVLLQQLQSYLKVGVLMYLGICMSAETVCCRLQAAAAAGLLQFAAGCITG